MQLSPFISETARDGPSYCRTLMRSHR